MVTADLIKKKAKILFYWPLSLVSTSNNNWPGHPPKKTVPNTAAVTSVPGGGKNAKTSLGRRGKGIQGTTKVI